MEDHLQRIASVNCEVSGIVNVLEDSARQPLRKWPPAGSKRDPWCPGRCALFDQGEYRCGRLSDDPRSPRRPQARMRQRHG